ncbi:MAG TPA: FlgD immunoglobulin-like domain containing protein, partial [Rubricoccaceae bacterium]|nr:FlgD immunoglobulin-like domain containing protein [Rubricoccaceae bacterium]
ALALTLGRSQAVTVAAFDVLGRRVATLHDGALGAGPHTFSFDGRSLPPGAYVVRLTADGASAARRVTVAR